jgi:hypothetical protein
VATEEPPALPSSRPWSTSAAGAGAGIRPHFPTAACAGAGYAPWSQCTPVSIAHPTAGTLTASDMPVDPLADDLTHIVYAQPANSSIITRQLFCMYELNNEASVPRVENNVAYLFKNVHTQTFLSVVGGAVAASAKTGYVAAAAAAQQAAVPLLYANNTLVSQYNGKALGVNASSSPTPGMLVEDPGTLPTDSLNFTISLYLYTGGWAAAMKRARIVAICKLKPTPPNGAWSLQAGCRRLPLLICCPAIPDRSWCSWWTWLVTISLPLPSKRTPSSPPPAAATRFLGPTCWLQMARDLRSRT